MIAAVAAVGCLVGIEQRVRGLGYRPSIVDDAPLWSLQRERVSDGAPETIALLGASRMQLAVSLDTFSSALPDREIVQLAIDGTSPVAALRDLALDSSFRGLALVDIVEWQVGAFGSGDSQQPWVDQYRRRLRAPGTMANRWLATWPQSYLAFLAAGGRRALGPLLTSRSWPAVPHVTTFSNRQRVADFRLRPELDSVRTKGLRAIEENVPPPPERWLFAARELATYASIIEARGGRVVFVRMPTSGPNWDAAEARYPRARYWDRLGSDLGLRTLHFRDDPTMASIDCPDWTHLDGKDAPRFTSALIEWLADSGVLTR